MADWQWYSREAQHFKREVTDPFFDALNEGAEKKVVNYLEKHRRPVNKLWEWDGEECWEYDIQGIWSMTFVKEYTTPLYITASKGYIECMRHLLDRRADVNYSPNGWSPLHAAVDGGHVDAVQLLINHGADVDLETEDTGKTALHMCCGKDYLKIAKLLLRRGTNINAKTYDVEETPLHVAAQNGLFDLVDLLLEKGADPNATNNEGDTPLALACTCTEGDSYYHSTVEKLIQWGADVNLKDKEKKLPLHNAARKGDHRLVELLVLKGSEINARDYFLKTPLFDAVAASEIAGMGAEGVVKGKPEKCVQILLNNGAWRIFPEIFHRVLVMCASYPPTVEVLINAYPQVKVPSLWMESIPKEALAKFRDFYEAFEILGRSPGSLQHLARSCLRDFLGRRCHSVISQLMIAPRLKRYLLLEPGEAGLH
ncbi:PREDICTED: ankyrin repeat and SOCS box protein 18-like isoform X2 [Branchiostoma belcheri]|uniref:Ankyrin repeat and SOCS box protein 18-like isoform X2 n=1 Tax=Branchiostoma belcheri TaxID=7741 RepID=A0A6P5A9Q9_BRABE|nr:PREDICTED: ankyrin repeat and SOCS box protein 18-like isoform X2 [Branchiostoma belcheri]